MIAMTMPTTPCDDGTAMRMCMRTGGRSVDCQSKQAQRTATIVDDLVFVVVFCLVVGGREVGRFCVCTCLCVFWIVSVSFGEDGEMLSVDTTYYVCSMM
jgi:hypothetical protein